MTTFWWNVLSSAIGQVFAYSLFQGFVKSWVGIKEIEEVKNFFNWLTVKVKQIKTLVSKLFHRPSGS